MADDRIMMKNPNTGNDDVRIKIAIYEPTRQAILEAIDDAESLPLSRLASEVEARTQPDLWEAASVMWFTTTVKLHLEATGLIAKNGSPQQLTLTDRGRSALAAN